MKTIILLSTLLTPLSSQAFPFQARRPEIEPRKSNLTLTWQGYYLPGAEGGTPFTPYYVPTGSSAIDDNSTSLVYSPAGAWDSAIAEDIHVNGTSHWSSEEGASVAYSFKGDSIVVFGSIGPDFGIVDIYIDSVLVSQNDLYSAQEYSEQAIFRSESLGNGTHDLRMVINDKRNPSSTASNVEIDALVITPFTESFDFGYDALVEAKVKDASLDAVTNTAAVNEKWTLVQKGTTGVSAMQLVVIDETHAVLIDKVAHNPLTIDGHPAWSALYNLQTNEVTPINLQSNSFCAGGSFLGDGTLINVGGNPVDASETGPLDFQYVDGIQGLRLLENCTTSAGCVWYDNPSVLKIEEPRWYPTVTRLDDGSAIIIGGSNSGGFINQPSWNVPSYEFYPSKGSGPVNSDFLTSTLNANLFAISFLLPDGKLFMAANQDAIIYDWKNNIETALPQIPNGVRVTYPMTGTGILLPLSEANNWQPEIMICGGSTSSDTVSPTLLKTSDPASDQCSRMVLTEAGIAAGWSVESLPHPWLMPDSVLTPDGKIIFANGCQSGYAGYGNVEDLVGLSNCANPVLQPVLYDPNAPKGTRFSTTGIPASNIPRVYHSVATLVPDGRIMIAGSSPCPDVCNEILPTEFRVEWLSSPALSSNRPVYSNLPKNIPFNSTFNLTVSAGSIPSGTTDVEVALMDLGFKTHSNSANMRLVYLTTQIVGTTLVVQAPPNGQIYPPGPGYIYLVVNGVPSEATKVIVGSGVNPT
ncbi:Immunoglobulin-like fold [Phaffia rhodozyma]|uniref:Immunoglobulin-like fold n=1 Tax=Phaffia rhodozyma TaxID=264483 RepID=A0A0F7SG75_PHARH|nr:Immunoglobulin-like fold [Phaffia rhodozyma]